MTLMSYTKKCVTNAEITDFYACDIRVSYTR